MKTWQNGASRLAMGVVVTALFAPLAAEANNFTIPAGTTSTTSQSMSGNQTGTIETGATLNTSGTAVAFTGTSSGVTITNSGTLISGNRGIDTNSGTVAALTITNAAGARISASDSAIRIGVLQSGGAVTITNAGSMVSTSAGYAIDMSKNVTKNSSVTINNAATGLMRSQTQEGILIGSGTTTITNAGTIDSTTKRAIRDTGALDDLVALSITNLAGGTIRADNNDAIQINGASGNATTAARITIDNAGLITAGAAGASQAINLDNLTSTAATVSIINRATGIISADNSDAIRPGGNFTITNYGQIIANAVPVPTDRPGADAIDLRTGHSGTIYNYGTISGAKNGTASDTGSNVTVYNYAGGNITGRNGAGVGSGGNATVYNWGTITGAIDSTSARGDGDGIDIDFALTLTNYGLIQGTGAKGYDGGGRINNSEGLAIGGGTVSNYGTITGTAAIVVNNDSNTDNSRGGSAALALTNYAGGTIVGQNSYAIRIESKTGTAIDNDTITNYGTIIGNGSIPDPNAIVLRQDGTPDPGSAGTLNGVTYTGTGSARFIRGDGSAIQMGEGNDVLTNYGTIIGNTGRAVNMEGGNDTVNIMKGSRIVGLVDGGAGTDTLNYNKVGLSAANRSALMAGQTVNIGGTLYTSFEIVNANAPSFSAFANANSRGIASLFDNLPLTATSAGTVNLLDTVAGASDVGAALLQLTPASYQSLGRMALNDATQTTGLVGQHLTENRMNGLGTDVSGAGNALAMFGNGMFDRNFGGDRALAAVMAFPGSAGSSLADAGWGADVTDAMAYAPYTKAPAGRLPVAVGADHGFFVTSGASFAREGARADAPAFRSTTVNVLAGYDQRLSDRITAGVFGGYAFTRGDLDSSGSNAKIGTGTIGGYGTYQAPGWFATLMGLYGFSDYTTSRMAFGTANNASFGGNHYAIRGSVGTDIRMHGWVVTPELGLQYTRVSTDSFTEAGSAVALIVGGDRSESLRSSLGARFAYDYALDGRVLTPELRFAWLHEFSDGVRGINASFADTTLPGSFVTATAGGLRDRGVLGAGLSGKLAPLTVLSVNYDAIVGGSDTVTHQVMARIKHAF